MENIVDNSKDQEVVEMQQQIEIAFQEWFAKFIDITCPPDDLKPMLINFFHACFLGGAAIGIKLSVNHYAGTTKIK